MINVTKEEVLNIKPRQRKYNAAGLGLRFGLSGGG
jgi:hypothetical protein